jgi:hypothetical protein
MTTTQITVLEALNKISNGNVLAKVTTADIAWHTQMNNLAVTSALNALIKKRYVRATLISNASASGGAYKNGYQITPVAKHILKMQAK